MSNSRSMAWILWIIASIFYAYQYILRVMPNIMLEDIMQQFHISATTFGQFSGVYYIGYSLMHIPLGISLDRFGPKKVMTICIILSVIGLLPLLYAEHWIYPIIGRLLVGMGSSAAILGVFKIIRMTFSEKRFPRMLSFSVTIGLMGAIYGGGPVSYMNEIYGYHVVIKLFIFGGLTLAAITYWIVPNIDSTEQSSIFSNIKEVLCNYRVLSSCFFAGLMVGPLEGFADVWGTSFLKHVYGLDSTLAASLPSLIFIGMCFGAPILSFIAEKFDNYLATIVGAGVVMLVCFFCILSWHLSPTSLSVCFILIGICCAYQILAIYITSRYVSEKVASLTTALANMMIMIFGYVFHTTISTIIDRVGGPNSSQALEYGLMIIPLGLLFGTIGFIYLIVIQPKASSKIEETKLEAIN